MFGQTSIASKRQILFYAALYFSPNCPHSAAKYAWPKTKYAPFRLIMPAQTSSYFDLQIARISTVLIRPYGGFATKH
jgi:hypothetical protein